MFARILQFALTQRLFIVVTGLLVIAMGIVSWTRLPIDAFPDIAPTQVKIIIKSPGMTTTEIESQITRIIENELLGIPNHEILRSTTKYAITDITVDFQQGTDIYWARQQVSERLSNLWPDLPKGISGGIAPMSTPLSEMFMFTVENDALSLTQKRELLDWHIRPILRSVSGVAEVNSLGGYVKTYEIVPELTKLQALSISQEDIRDAIASNNLNSGLGKVELGNDVLLVRIQGQYTRQHDIGNQVIAHRLGQAIRLSDVAEVNIGHLTRYGAVTRNGTETVQGLVIALKGANTATVVEQVKRKLDEISPSLPDGTDINVFYDRANLIGTATDTINSALIQAIVLVILLLLVFLGDIRAAIAVSCSLPLAVLSTFLLMDLFSLSANLMSLGGLVIAIGMLVDSSVVVIENSVNQLSTDSELPKLHKIFRASSSVALPIVSGALIVVIVFSPLMTLTGLEGKLFSPVAFTIVFAMLSSLVFSLTLIPVLASFLLKPKTTTPSHILWLQAKYKFTLESVLAKPQAMLVIISIVLLSSVWFFNELGKTFMPDMDEGDIIVQLEKPPTISLQASIELDKQIEQKLLQEIPEIVQIVSRTGADELGLDPMSLNESDLFMELKHPSDWRFDDKSQLEDAIRSVLHNFPGINLNFTQPIQMRVSEMLTGSSGDVSVKVFGANVEKLAQLAGLVSELANTIQGAKDVQMALVEGGSVLNIRPKSEVMAQMNISNQVLTDYYLALLEGRHIAKVIENKKYTPILFNNSSQSDKQQPLRSIADIKNSQILLPGGKTVLLSQVADLEVEQVPLLIEREQGQRFAAINMNVENRDIVGFVNELKARIGADIDLPIGYNMTFGGEFENQQRATVNLLYLVPVALLLIFLILFSTFKSLSLASLILANIPFALMGGVIALFLSGEYLSVPASVGFIALLGIAVLNSVVMVGYFEQAKFLITGLNSRVIAGAVSRLRPILMTATTALFGLLPLVYATGPGAEIQKPLAIVVIGGLITSTITTLYLVPIFYRMLETRNERRA